MTDRPTEPLFPELEDDPSDTPGPGGSADPGGTAGAGSSTAGESPAAVVPVSTRPGVRVGTIVWGLVIVARGIGVLVVNAGYTLDVELAFIVLLAAAGTAMLLGTLLKGRRGGAR